MRRFVTLAVLLFVTVPFGISISGCGKKTPVTFCNGGDSGPVVGQLFAITLQPQLLGISINFAQQATVAAGVGTDCKGTTVTLASPIYGTTDMTIADINPTNGTLCGGTWNRNTGGGIADFTTCNPTNKSGTAFITVSSNGATSNPIAVSVHPIVTSVVLGSPSTDCINDPATNCTVNPTTKACTPTVVVNPYTGSSCLSQGGTGQLAARVYAGTGASQQNISCLAGHLAYTPQDTTIVTIDQNGVATAALPGSTIISTTVANASSSAGFFSTCPPASIVLTPANSTSTNPITVNQNFTQPLTATVTDTLGKVLTGVALSYVSTTPTTLPTSTTASITPIFPGSGAMVAVCEPPTCNPSPFNQIGLFGNGKPVFSNRLVATTPGTNSTVLYIASTQSLYLVPVDFTSTTIGAPVRLPYSPNSMVISNDGSSIYMGSSTELMIFNALTNAFTKPDPTVQGSVLAISPDNTTLVISDTTRQLVYLYSPASMNPIISTIGGVATRAQFSPDSSTVYITAGNQLLVHSTLTGWTSISGSTNPALVTPVSDVAIAVPSQGAFFAGTTTTARGACAATTVTTTNGVPSTSNILYPDAGVLGPTTDRIAATNDGQHVIGVTATTATLTDLFVSSLNANNPSKIPGQCPNDNSALKFTTNPVLTTVIPGITTASITGVVPSSDSSNVFITYTGTGGILPLYNPAASGPGTLSSVTLSTFGTAAPIAPVAGVFSADNTKFYAGTSGDNLVHILSKGTSGFVDTTTPIAPKLPGPDGTTIVVPNLLVQRPRLQT